MALVITGGEKNGAHLYQAPVTLTRPTSCRARQALFSIILSKFFQDGFYGKSCLDCFCGSGSIGLELLSRGATNVTFVEKDSIVFSFLKQNIQKLSYEKNSILLKASFEKAVYKNTPFDLIFCDPPYGKISYEEILDFFSKSTLTTKDTLLVLETNNQEILSSSHWSLLDVRSYGLVRFHFFKKEP